MEYVGIDVHKNQRQICILAEPGELIYQRIRTDHSRFAAVLGDRPNACILHRGIDRKRMGGAVCGGTGPRGYGHLPVLSAWLAPGHGHHHPGGDDHPAPAAFAAYCGSHVPSLLPVLAKQLSVGWHKDTPEPPGGRVGSASSGLAGRAWPRGRRAYGRDVPPWKANTPERLQSIPQKSRTWG
jgi:hypothetical protein